MMKWTSKLNLERTPLELKNCFRFYRYRLVNASCALPLSALPNSVLRRRKFLLSYLQTREDAGRSVFSRDDREHHQWKTFLALWPSPSKRGLAGEGRRVRREAPPNPDCQWLRALRRFLQECRA